MKNILKVLNTYFKLLSHYYAILFQYTDLNYLYHRAVLENSQYIIENAADLVPDDVVLNDGGSHNNINRSALHIPRIIFQAADSDKIAEQRFDATTHTLQAISSVIKTFP